MKEMKAAAVMSLRGRETMPRVTELIAMAMRPDAPETELSRAGEIAAEYGMSAALELFGVVEQGELLGIAGIHYIDDGVMVLRDLAVWPGARHRGFGRMLLDYLRAELRPPEIRGNTWPEAAPFYRACGFEVQEEAVTDGGRRLSFCWVAPS